MELEIIPFTTVEHAILEARAEMKTTNKFNTAQHSHDEIATVVPESPGFQHVKPSMVPGKYYYWISLIMTSQGSKEWHVLELSRHLASEILNVFSIWHITGNLNHDYIANLVDLFPARTLTGVDTRALCGSDWFLRLDLCSPKDGKSGIQPARYVVDFVEKLCTSMRATTAIRDILDEGPETKPRLYLVPYNKDMDPGREFRVFCPPPTGKIAAISQYRWTEPLDICIPETAQAYAQKVYTGASEIHREIMDHAEKLEDASILQTIRREGFSFDVAMPPAGQVQFVEINPFGAMSGCGSCLYHWIDDAALLYGLRESKKVGVRMAL